MEKFLIIIFRTILLYAVIVVIFRLMGKREIGELSILDLVVFIMIGEMAVIAIEDHTDPLMNTLVPMVTLLLIQVAISFSSLKSRTFRELIDGKPIVLIKNGQVDELQMRKSRYNFDDLLMQLRTKDINYISDVEFAILETYGELSIVKKTKQDKKPTYTIPFIIDGVIQERELTDENKTKEWLIKELKNRGHTDIENISFCSYEKGQFFIDYTDEQ